MITPFQGCGSERAFKKMFLLVKISKNPERVTAFRIG
jgi:hypothetical protein